MKSVKVIVDGIPYEVYGFEINDGTAFVNIYNVEDIIVEEKIN